MISSLISFRLMKISYALLYWHGDGTLLDQLYTSNRKKYFTLMIITNFHQKQFLTCYLIFNFRPTYFSYCRKITSTPQFHTDPFSSTHQFHTRTTPFQPPKSLSSTLKIPKFNTPPQFHTFSAPKIPQFNTKNPWN